VAEIDRRLSNTRPRDELGRPLPWGSAGFPQVPERDHVATDLAVNEALTYLAQAHPFHAHEVLEQRWRSCPEAERTYWRAMAQAAAAATQAARVNIVGAQRLWTRAADTICSPDTAVPADVSVHLHRELIHQLWLGDPPVSLCP
jgi:hypothetical protein